MRLVEDVWIERISRIEVTERFHFFHHRVCLNWASLALRRVAVMDDRNLHEATFDFSQEASFYGVHPVLSFTKLTSQEA